MSLVGPRPPLPRRSREYEDWQLRRLEVPPGITGLWQVGGRSELSFDDTCASTCSTSRTGRSRYDLYIVAKTLPVLVQPRRHLLEHFLSSTCSSLTPGSGRYLRG